MKKLVVFSLVLLMAAGAAFAQIADGISMFGFGRATFVPAAFLSWKEYDPSNPTALKDEKAVKAFSGVSWAENNYITFGIKGDWEVLGFTADVQFSYNPAPGTLSIPDIVSANDYAEIWGKPFGNDWLTVRMGKFKVDNIRGKIGNLNGGFESFTLSQGGEEDAIFHRFESGLGGFLLSSQPVEGLFIGAKIEVDPRSTTTYDGGSDTEGPDWVYQTLQFGAGYNIENVGLIRAQYIGGTGNLKPGVFPADANPARIEAAFALTAMENLLVDLGAKIYLPIKDDATKDTWTDGFQLNLGATFSAGDFGIGATVQTNFGAVTKHDSGDPSNGQFVLNAHLAPTYNVGFATFGLDFGMVIKGKSKAAGKEVDDNTSQFGFGAYIDRALGGNGSIKAGLALQLPETNKDGDSTWGGAATPVINKTVFSIPVILTYSF